MNNQEKRSILCPNCRRLISMDEVECPYCGLRSPGSRMKNNFWTRAMLGGDQFVMAVIYVNAAMFILSILINPGSTKFSMDPFSLLSPGGNTLMLLGASGTIPINLDGRWWTLLSANYLHAGILHILFNMAAFRQICPLILQTFGGYRTIVIYTLGGVGGYIASYFAGIPFTVGASAAVCGLIGAAMYYGKSRGGQFGEMVYKQLSGWALGILLFGFLIPGINNWAHGGGFICGAATAFLVGYSERTPEKYYHKTVAGICVLATAAALVWGVVTTLVYVF